MCVQYARAALDTHTHDQVCASSEAQQPLLAVMDGREQAPLPGCKLDRLRCK